jgi:ATP-binding cassette subfamily F protein 3
MVSRGGIEPFDGDLDDYQRYLLDEAKRQRELIKETANRAAAQARTDQAAKVEAEKKKPQPNQRLRRELEQVDARMAELNREGASLEERLGVPLPPAEIAELGQRFKVVNGELLQLEERWLELTSALET